MLKDCWTISIQLKSVTYTCSETELRISIQLKSVTYTCSETELKISIQLKSVMFTCPKAESQLPRNSSKTKHIPPHWDHKLSQALGRSSKESKCTLSCHVGKMSPSLCLMPESSCQETICGFITSTGAYINVLNTTYNTITKKCRIPSVLILGLIEFRFVFTLCSLQRCT